MKNDTSKMTVLMMTPEELDILFQKRIKEALDNFDTLPKDEFELLKVVDVAKLLKVSKVTIHQWKKKGLIPFTRISNKVYFNKKDVLSALKKINVGRRRI